MNINRDNGSPQQLTFMLKGGKMRFEPSGQMSVIIDPATQRMMVILSAQRMYMERDFGHALASMEQQAAGTAPAIVHTEKMDIVAGYKCEARHHHRQRRQAPSMRASHRSSADSACPPRATRCRLSRKRDGSRSSGTAISAKGGKRAGRRCIEVTAIKKEAAGCFLVLGAGGIPVIRDAGDQKAARTGRHVNS